MFYARLKINYTLIRIRIHFSIVVAQHCLRGTVKPIHRLSIARHFRVFNNSRHVEVHRRRSFSSDFTPYVTLSIIDKQSRRRGVYQMLNIRCEPRNNIKYVLETLSEHLTNEKKRNSERNNMERLISSRACTPLHTDVDRRTV